MRTDALAGPGVSLRSDPRLPSFRFFRKVGVRSQGYVAASGRRRSAEFSLLAPEPDSRKLAQGYPLQSAKLGWLKGLLWAGFPARKRCQAKGQAQCRDRDPGFAATARWCIHPGKPSRNPNPTCKGGGSCLPWGEGERGTERPKTPSPRLLQSPPEGRRTKEILPATGTKLETTGVMTRRFASASLADSSGLTTGSARH